MHPGRLGRQLQLGGFGSVNRLVAGIFHRERFQQIVTAAAKAQGKHAFRLFFAGDGILCHLIDARLVELRFAFFHQHVLALRLRDIQLHLQLFVLTAEIDFAFLNVGLIHHFLILLRIQVRLGGAEFFRSVIHHGKHGFQAGRLWRGRGGIRHCLFRRRRHGRTLRASDCRSSQ